MLQWSYGHVGRLSRWVIEEVLADALIEECSRHERPVLSFTATNEGVGSRKAL
jgi:hypothetical protein